MDRCRRARAHGRIGIQALTLMSALIPPVAATAAPAPAGAAASHAPSSRPAIRAAARLHEIPAHVTVVVFVKPERGRMRLLVRAPLEAMRDMSWPTRGPGYLELDRIDDMLRDAAQLWIAGYLELHEESTVLARPEVIATRVSLPSDRSFGNWNDALAHTLGTPLPPATELIWQQALLDVLLEVPITSATANFSIRPGLDHLGIRTATVLRFLPAAGSERAFRYSGDPGLVRLDPRWHHAFLRFVGTGFTHILDGIDHLLFVLCLVIPFRRLRPLVAIITSFTIAHSITLIVSALGLAPDALWFPPLIETLIALSIVWMAFENIAGAKLERRWLFAFAFGLVHGFGFSFLLRESLQFGGSHLVTSLLAFNIGVELGQLLVVVLAIPLIDLLFRRFVRERIGTILLSALVAHEAWHWMGARAGQLRQFELSLPTVDLPLLIDTMRALMLALIVVGVAWLLHGAFGRLFQRDVAAADATDAPRAAAG